MSAVEGRVRWAVLGGVRSAIELCRVIRACFRARSLVSALYAFSRRWVAGSPPLCEVASRREGWRSRRRRMNAGCTTLAWVPDSGPHVCTQAKYRTELGHPEMANTPQPCHRTWIAPLCRQHGRARQSRSIRSGSAPGGLRGWGRRGGSSSARCRCRRRIPGRCETARAWDRGHMLMR